MEEKKELLDQEGDSNGRQNKTILFLWKGSGLYNMESDMQQQKNHTVKKNYAVSFPIYKKMIKYI